MATKLELRAFFGVTALALACAGATGCVADRPSRNGVFNENQYIRKDFLIRPGDSATVDQGWILKATITTASEPNPFGESSLFGLYPGSHNNGLLVHFVATSDKLQMINSREISASPDIVATGRQAEIINAWPITNVDLKYRINLDGEKTNFYEENQELSWDVRQWVKVNFDKNDMSDLAPLGSYLNQNIAKCVGDNETSATIEPNSFLVDEANNYMEWTVQATFAIKWSDPDCIEAFGAGGDAARRLGRDFETVSLKYSLTRAQVQPTYLPMIIGEKDSIRRKYGPITYTATNRDPDTGLLAATEYVVRFDPQKPIVWYFEKDFPNIYKSVFTRNNLPPDATPLAAGVPTIEESTNSLLSDAAVPARVTFKEWNAPLDDGTPTERKFGDVRYNMVRFLQTYDQQSYFAGVSSGVVDPRNGEAISQDIVFSNFAIKDYYVTRIDAYLQTIGASLNLLSSDPWADPTVPDANGNPVAVACVAGAAVPIIQSTVKTQHNGQSTLYQKMQGYMYRPVDQYGPLGPQDFILDHTQDKNDFQNAYFAYLPYIVYGDPSLNQFVTPEGGSANYNGGDIWQMIHNERLFHELTTSIDQGHSPFDPTSATGSVDALAFMNQLKSYSVNHRQLAFAKQAARMNPANGLTSAHADAVTDFAIESVMQKDARHCVAGTDGNLHWETKEEWVNSLIFSYWSQVFWHEFGHAMGLEHNFMASVDKTNFPVVGTDAAGNKKYGLYASSVMEYNAAPDRVFWGADWGPYDKGAISWIYANPSGVPNAVPTGSKVLGVSGQVSATAPWNDPKGFVGDTETQFLYCNERHTKYTPLCRAGDLGTTPSEITANEIEMYEWQYKWRNFRQYRKIWDLTNYADTPLNVVTEMRRFTSLWAYDMSGSEVTQALQRIGIKVPTDATSAQLYYAQLTDKFTDEMSHAATLTAAFHEALIQQSSGQRPYVTVYDNYFGDTTQQGIALDKLFALQSWLALWPVDNYDPHQAAGSFISSYTPFGLSDNINGTGIGSLYQTVAEQATDAMTASPFDAFAYYRPLGVAEFTQDTHSIDFVSSIAGASRTEVQDWIGGYVFNRLDDFLAFFRDLAVTNNFVDTANGIDCRGEYSTCKYDPRTPRAYLQDTWFSDTYNEFLAPDGRRYIWVYVKDRNQWVVADRDRNSATYTIMRNYTTDVILQKDDGNYAGSAFTDAQQVKYFLDYYNMANATPH